MAATRFPKILVLLLMTIPFVLGSVAGFGQTADFYVASNGNDSWPGTLSQPFRTVDRARLAVQTRKTQVSGRTITVFGSVAGREDFAF